MQKETNDEVAIKETEIAYTDSQEINDKRGLARTLTLSDLKANLKEGQSNTSQSDILQLTPQQTKLFECYKEFTFGKTHEDVSFSPNECLYRHKQSPKTRDPSPAYSFSFSWPQNSVKSFSSFLFSSNNELSNMVNNNKISNAGIQMEKSQLTKTENEIFSVIAKKTEQQIAEKVANATPLIHFNNIEITKKNKLVHLFKVLTSLFINELQDLNQAFKLNEKEFVIFELIIFKKTKIELKNKEELEDQSLNNRILNSFKMVSCKRKEENCKFIYKSVLKRMMRNFEEAKGLPVDENIQFYRHYFGNYAKEKDIQVECFWDPTSQRIPHANDFIQEFRSINHDFLNLVFSVPVFREEFRRILISSKFMENCRIKVQKKFVKLLNKWDKIIRKFPAEHFKKELCGYFGAAKKCKLPWTIFEVEVAKTYFCSLVKFG